VIGRRREGKTTLALHLALQNPGGVAAFDIRREYRGFPTARTAEEFSSLLDSVPRVVVYQPQFDLRSEFSAFALALWRRGFFTLLIDEASQLQTASGAHEWLDRFVRMADCSVSLVQALHRPVDASVLCRSLATDWYIFRTTEPRDLEAVAERCGEEVARAASSLPHHHFVHFEVDAQRSNVCADPRSWFVLIRKGGKKKWQHHRRSIAARPLRALVPFAAL
jgi:hypothetical protein